MGSSRLRSITALLTISLCLMGSLASAADKPLVETDQGMDTRLFRSAVDTKGHFTVDATPVLPHLSFSVGLMLDFGFHQWVAAEHDGDVYEYTRVDTFIASNRTGASQPCDRPSAVPTGLPSRRMARLSLRALGTTPCGSGTPTASQYGALSGWTRATARPSRP